MAAIFIFPIPTYLSVWLIMESLYFTQKNALVLALST